MSNLKLFVERNRNSDNILMKILVLSKDFIWKSILCTKNLKKSFLKLQIKVNTSIRRTILIFALNMRSDKPLNKKKIVKNLSHLNDLLHFYKELEPILKSKRIKPVLFGSLAYAILFQDETCVIDDMDFVVFTRQVEIIKQEIKKHKNFTFKERGKGLDILKNHLKISFSKYEEGIKFDTHLLTIKINDVKLKIISPKYLIYNYDVGYKKNRKIIHDGKKLQNLRKLGKQLFSKQDILK